MSTSPDLSWVQVLSRGQSKKVINTQPRRVPDDRFKMVPKVLYEHEDLKAEVLTRKATAILQQALTAGSVLFTFPNKTFDHRTTAYRMIKEQLSADVQFRPLSLYHQKPNGDLLVEAKFSSQEATQRALRLGITHQDVVYKATAVKDNSEGTLTHVQMTIVRMPEMETFVGDLQRSLKYYGKVCQIKKYTIDGFFEGHVSIMIDTSVKYKDAEGHEYMVQPLSRMLYLSAWDVYVPATYCGAPPVCRKLGHTAKFCKKEAEKSFEDALQEYELTTNTNDRSDSTPATTQRRSDEEDQ
ncbi:hypothetical protein MBANPS3_012360 [Mucor bainieri]